MQVFHARILVLCHYSGMRVMLILPLLVLYYILYIVYIYRTPPHPIPSHFIIHTPPTQYKRYHIDYVISCNKSSLLLLLLLLSSSSSSQLIRGCMAIDSEPGSATVLYFKYNMIYENITFNTIGSATVFYIKYNSI